MSESEQIDAFQVFLRIQRARAAKGPLSLVRLNDAEGTMLGYPRFTNRDDVNAHMYVWFGTRSGARSSRWQRRIYMSSRLKRLGRFTRTWPEKEVLALADGLKHAVATADVVGLPLKKHVEASPQMAAVEKSLTAFRLTGESTALTSAAVHRFLNSALLYRPMLKDADFVGVVSSRDVVEKLRRLFGAGEIRWYPTRAEPDCPNDVAMPHWPDGFNRIRETLEVPYPGALFLVGAGICGKIYCQWIKERGGVAVDIGSMFDSWAGVGRTGSPVRNLDVYERYPRIGRTEAMVRYNTIAEALNDGVRVDAGAGYVADLPEYW